MRNKHLIFSRVSGPELRRRTMKCATLIFFLASLREFISIGFIIVTKEWLMGIDGVVNAVYESSLVIQKKKTNRQITSLMTTLISHHFQTISLFLAVFISHRLKNRCFAYLFLVVTK